MHEYLTFDTALKGHRNNQDITGGKIWHFYQQTENL